MTSDSSAEPKSKMVEPKWNRHGARMSINHQLVESSQGSLPDLAMSLSNLAVVAISNRVDMLKAAAG